ncbi:hypothetical protein K435DRAFT_864004 [Dendrothele bispora CBS 962.96]|uniref:Uncharacterized protein n=1 Tax=Dendrothele bispora (strain CBS 962.96) TaxID=1314807 RepID=A0A4S8LPC5_DENBC|nr:hypothetical protein K435DRAFT_864004 [Dendrothele bispora CBS 962.96]
MSFLSEKPSRWQERKTGWEAKGRKQEQAVKKEKKEEQEEKHKPITSSELFLSESLGVRVRACSESERWRVPRKLPGIVLSTKAPRNIRKPLNLKPKITQIKQRPLPPSQPPTTQTAKAAKTAPPLPPPSPLSPITPTSPLPPLLLLSFYFYSSIVFVTIGL